jgi:nonribosomal peptide synthetase protein BlmVI
VDHSGWRVLSYGELASEALALAAHIRHVAPRTRYLVLAMPSGAGFVRSFLASQLAGLVAIPLPVPGLGRATGELLNEVMMRLNDALLVVESDLPQVRHIRSRLVLTAIRGTPNERLPNPIDSEFAYCQFTSGSTSRPTGILIPHTSLIEEESWRPPGPSVNWLPLFHDFGLVSGVVRPVRRGDHSVLMDPRLFANNPGNWLAAISRARAVATASPNFGLAHTMRRCADIPRELNLSSLEVISCGGEMVDSSLVDRFESHYGAAGLRSGVLSPSYGLAEALATGPLGVSVTPHDRPRRRLRVAPGVALTYGSRPVDTPNGRVLAGAGRILPGRRVALLDATRSAEVNEGSVGEIALLSDDPGSYLPGFEGDSFRRASHDGGAVWYTLTGDLGCFRDDELFIVGRTKDIVIIRGQNFDCGDLESSLRGQIDDLATATIVACEVEGELGLAVACAPNAGGDRDQLAAEIRQAVAQTIGIQPTYLALVAPSNIPKTTSGKVNRPAVVALLRDAESKP